MKLLRAFLVVVNLVLFIWLTMKMNYGLSILENYPPSEVFFMLGWVTALSNLLNYVRLTNKTRLLNNLEVGKISFMANGVYLIFVIVVSIIAAQSGSFDLPSLGDTRWWIWPTFVSSIINLFMMKDFQVQAPNNDNDDNKKI